MKLLIKIFLIVIVILSIVFGIKRLRQNFYNQGPISQSITSQSEISTYTQTEDNYSFSFPKAWAADFKPGRGFDVHIFDRSQKESVEIFAFVHSIDIDKQLDDEKSILQKDFNAVVLDQVQQTTISGNKSYKLPFSYTEFDKSHKGIIFLISKDSKVYGLTFFGESVSYDKYEEMIVNSFKVL